MFLKTYPHYPTSPPWLEGEGGCNPRNYKTLQSFSGERKEKLGLSLLDWAIPKRIWIGLNSSYLLFDWIHQEYQWGNVRIYLPKFIWINFIFVMQLRIYFTEFICLSFNRILILYYIDTGRVCIYDTYILGVFSKNELFMHVFCPYLPNNSRYGRSKAIQYT